MNLTSQQKQTIAVFLSLSGLTLISFGSLIILQGHFETNIQASLISPATVSDTISPSTTINHYLLSSQNNFSKAISLQQSQNVAPFINEAISSASVAIDHFPQDPRGWAQRLTIYLSLVDSQPQLISPAIADCQQLMILEPKNTAHYHSLIRLYEKSGNLPEALKFYYRLLPLTSEAEKRNQLLSQISSIRSLLTQLPTNNTHTNLTPTQPLILSEKLLQASTTDNLVIASPQENISFDNNSRTGVNALSGQSTLTSGSKSVNIINNTLKPSSQIYLTITKGGKNQNLQVLSRDTSSFTVGLDSPIHEDIEFKWWIVN